jgi:galactokinase/mevalonate kinase-like predicted kinase
MNINNFLKNVFSFWALIKAASESVAKKKTAFTKKKDKQVEEETPEIRAKQEKFAEKLARAMYPDIYPAPRTEEELKEAVVRIAIRIPLLQ